MQKSMNQRIKSVPQKKETGNKGEEIAVQYLQSLGYKILERNWRIRHYELDIIARDGNELVIVEVKARTGEKYDHPAEAVGNKKIRYLINATESYIHKKNVNLNTRFDIISVIFLERDFKLEHFKDAFHPTA